MIELARELKNSQLVHLGKISKITGVSENYLAQLAIPLRNDGLIIGVSGKRGGYHLTRPPEKITVADIVKAVDGPMTMTDCVMNPDICLNSSFCEARMMWVILSDAMEKLLHRYTLADMIDKKKIGEIREEYSHLQLLDADKFLSTADAKSEGSNPV